MSLVTDYKTVVVQVKENSQLKRLDDKVNKLLNEGWQPLGPPSFDHCSAGSMDIIQTMVKRCECDAKPQIEKDSKTDGKLEKRKDTDTKK